MVIRWARIRQNRVPVLSLLHAIPNGGSRHPAEAANLKRQGVVAGIPDLFLPVPAKGKHGLYIEMKRKKGGRLSPYQKDVIDRLQKIGYEVIVAKGADEAIQAIETYLGDERKE